MLISARCDGTFPAATRRHLSQRAGKLIEEWKQALVEDDTANIVAAPPTTGRKRKAVSSHASQNDGRTWPAVDGVCVLSHALYRKPRTSPSTKQRCGGCMTGNSCTR